MLDFDWIVEGQVMAMAMPWPDEWPEIERLGIQAVLSLTERVPPGLPEEKVRHLHLPVVDFHPPTQEQLDRGVAFVNEAVEAGHLVAVHCAAGRGRTGTFMAAYLVSCGRDAVTGILEVRRRRPGSVETRAQEAAVAEFARRKTGRGG